MTVTDLAPIHVIGFLISLALFYQSTRLLSKGKENVFEFLLWIGFGVGILVLSIGSSVTVLGVLDKIQFLLEILGFQSGQDGIFVLAILGLLLMLFYTYINAKTNRQDIYNLNQELALLRYELQQQDNQNQENEQHKEQTESNLDD